MKQFLYILIILVAAQFAGVGKAYAQNVPGSDTWPMDSVVRGGVHLYTVPGDPNYMNPSTFIWTVSGGRIFLDADTLQPAVNESTVTLKGDPTTNITHIYVVWDRFDQPLDTGWVYVHEISPDGCEYDSTDARAWEGMKIRVSAPPKVWFLVPEINLCSYDTDTMVIAAFEGMPPYDLKFSIDGIEYERRITQADLSDIDGDGKKNNLAWAVNGFFGTTTEIHHTFRLIEASSGGIVGSVLDYPETRVNIYVQPPAPGIQEDNIEVTSLYGNKRRYQLGDFGVNPKEYFWYLYTEDGNLVQETGATSDRYWIIDWYHGAGKYYMLVNYNDGTASSCASPFDTLWIDVFEPPTITISATTGNMKECSALEAPPHDSLDFLVQYRGAAPYFFSYQLKDYNGNVLVDSTMNYQTVRDIWIQFEHVLMNLEKPEINRVWTFEITKAWNYEGLPVEVSTLDGLRFIEVHPKPVIEGEIDLYNSY